MKKILILLFLFLPAIAGAQFSRRDLVKVRAMTATDAAHAGSELKVVVATEITKGFHINDHLPTLDYLISTKVVWEPHPAISPGKMVYPSGELKTFEFSDIAISVYEGTLLIGGSLGLSSKVAPGEHSLQGSLSYQACNEKACFPPTRVPVEVRFRIVPSDTALERLHTEIFDQVKFE